LLPAIAALPKAVPNALRRIGGDLVCRADDAAVRAFRAIRPKDAFEEGERRFLIAEIGAVKNGHRTGSMASNTPEIYFKNTLAVKREI
jgi:hypothetical protein